jgi:hypothetical protein
MSVVWLRAPPHLPGRRLLRDYICLVGDLLGGLLGDLLGDLAFGLAGGLPDVLTSISLIIRTMGRGLERVCVHGQPIRNSSSHFIVSPTCETRMSAMENLPDCFKLVARR